METLRLVRDTYRSYVKPKAKGPLVEMNAVILRLGVKDWAVMLVRQAALAYAGFCFIRTDEWNPLFGFEGPMNHLFRQTADEQGQAEPTFLPPHKLQQSINALLNKDCFHEVVTGGPFGRDSQFHLARSYPGQDFLLQRENFTEALNRRLRTWDASQPWVEGLSRLFDAAQEEVFYQEELLGAEGQEAELTLIELTTLQSIALRHLSGLGPRDPAIHATRDEQWELLLRELDLAQIAVEAELAGVPRETLMTLRKKGHVVETWSDCYRATNAVVLGDGSTHTLRREVCKFLHNAAKKANYQRAKIWSRPNPKGPRLAKKPRPEA